MGEFLAVSAVREGDEKAVAQFIGDYCKKYKLAVSPLEDIAKPNEHTDALIYPQNNGWLRIVWPDRFPDFATCREMSAIDKNVISTIHSHDGSLWEHLFLNHGRELHKFSSWPEYYFNDPAQIKAAKEKWRGDGAELAKFLNIPLESIKYYFLQYPFIQKFPAPPTSPNVTGFQAMFAQSKPTVAKAYPADKFELDNFWVFVDFWKKLGIAYPGAKEKPSMALRLGEDFRAKLPKYDG